MTDGIETAIQDTLVSSVELDRNNNPANVVDGLFAIAKAIEEVASALRGIDSSITDVTVGNALRGLASLEGIVSAINDVGGE